MTKLRILQVVPSLVPGGAERMMIHLMRGLDPTRYTVAAVSLGDRLGSDLEVMADIAGATVWYLGKHAGFDPRMYWRLNRVLRQFQPDVVHTHLNALLYAAPVVAALRTPIMIYTAHNFPEFLVDGWLRWFYRACFHHGVMPVSITNTLTPVLRREFDLPDLPMIRNGIPVAQFPRARQWRTAWRNREGFGPDEFLFVCAARFSAQKNHALLLRAFARKTELCQRARILLAGDGELRDGLANLATELGIESRVHFLGNRTDVPELLAASDAFLLSSVQEANPLCVMEAMAAGLPVIATAVGGVPELVESGVHGLLVEPGNVEGFANAMSRMLQDGELRKQCGERSARRAAEDFDVSDMARAYDDLYCRCLQKESKPLLAAA